jgi:hypothetical protein
MDDGAAVISPEVFLLKRRPEILHALEENVYGRTPALALPLQMRVTSVDEHALGGRAIRKQIRLTVNSVGPTRSISRDIHLLLYLPVQTARSVPVFVGLNFNGNQSVSADPGIDLNKIWVPDPALDQTPLAKELKGHMQRTATEQSRGSDASQWPIEHILGAGFGVATIYAGDIEPDFATGIGYGVRPLLFEDRQTLPAADDWGAIGAWAWGMSRAVDYLLTEPGVDPHSIIAIGHSRFGKTALWAAAQDPRFSMVISNESGQGGATLSRRQIGETIAHANIAFPYWFCANYHHFTGQANLLPVDGDLLLALIAPRPLFVASAAADPYSDPEGEFVSSVEASRVYRLMGTEGLPSAAQYETGHLWGDTLTYYVRPGGHDILDEDWTRYLDFAKRHLAKRSQQK